MKPFIVIEGPDGCGKSVQTKAVAERIDAIATCEPTIGPIGDVLRRGLRHEVHFCRPETMALLFAADRLEHCGWIEQLRRTRMVVCDRFDHSSAVYQTAMTNRGVARAGVGWLTTINALADRPDLVVVLDVPVEVSLERRRARGGDELYDGDGLQLEVHRLYRDLSWLPTSDPTVHIDGTGTQADVTDRIVAAIRTAGLA